MRILSTPPTSPYPLTPFPDIHESPRHRGARPTTHSITVGEGYTAATLRSQRPIRASVSVGDHSTLRYRQLISAQSHATFVYPASDGARTSSSTLSPIQHSPEVSAAPATMTMQWQLEPPPLDFKKSPYCCIPLPDVAHGPVNISPILAYNDGCRAYNERDVFQGQSVNDDHYMCAPATNPSLGSITILLPNSRGVTVHASLKKHSFVTVGDVLEALDTVLLGKPSRELSLPREATYGHGGSLYASSSGTALRSLRSRYERAGMTRSPEGFDVWDLRVG